MGVSRNGEIEREREREKVRETEKEERKRELMRSCTNIIVSKT